MLLKLQVKTKNSAVKTEESKIEMKTEKGQKVT